MKQKLLILMFVLCSQMLLNAQTFTSSGINYNIISATTVEVGNNSSYIGNNAVIPSNLVRNGVSYSVKRIGDSAFSSCSGLTSISIPSSVTNIGSSAFYFCSALTSISIPSSVTSIADYAFAYCNALKSVTVNWQTPLTINTTTFLATPVSSAVLNVPAGKQALYATATGWKDFGKEFTVNGIKYFATSATTAEVTFNEGIPTGAITIPSSVTTTAGFTYSVTRIGDSAFSDCSGLTSITIPSSVTSIGSSAFSSCSGLTSISIPSSVTSIGTSAFSVCSGLTSISIPSSVTNIGSSAFYFCSALTSISIPSSVTSIADYAFAYCNALKSVTVNWQTPLTINTTTFLATTVSSAVLNVPAGKQALYAAATGWKDFSKICSAPFAPTAQPQTFCGSASVANLVATGTSLKWYTAASGGTALASTTSLSTRNYFVSQTGGDCNRESARTQVAVTVNPLPSAPTALAQAFCGVATVANLVATGTGIKWYNVATGGTPLNSTNALSTGNYFVSQTVGNCESTRTQVAITVNPLPSAPTALAQSFCGAATVANLVATGTSLKWYNAATGGITLDSNTVLSTGNYFVSQTVGNCESTRTQVAITVNPLPSAPTALAQSFCGAATVANLVATGTILKWYNAATGGTPLNSTNVLISGNYFASQTVGNCESTRTQVAVTVNPSPISPTANAQTFCGSTTVAKLLPAPSTTIKWYNVATGGTALISTAAITASANYYVTSVSATGCESARKLVTITINALPSTPVASAQSFCGNATVANLVAAGTSLKWYNVATGGTPLLSTTSLTTGNYYVSQSSTTCESSRRLVAVTVNTLPNAPTANSNQTFVQGATVAKLLPTPSSTIKWYNVATGGTPIDSITVLSTGNYYVSQTNNLCESARTLVAVTINQIPSAPIASAQSFNGSATVANLVATGSSLKWYNVATGGTPLLSTTSLITGNYYVSQTVGAIESSRTLVPVTVNIIPSAPVASAQTFCSSATVANLVATGSSLKWYNVATSGTPLLSTTS